VSAPISVAQAEWEENQKQCELKDFLVIRPLIIVGRGHGVTYSGLSYPNTKVVIRLALAVTNHGKRGVILRELQNVAIGVEWDGQILGCSASTSLDDRLVKGFPYINVGDCDALFYEFESIEMLTQFPPPMQWSQFGTVRVKASLWAGVCTSPYDPIPRFMRVDFDVVAPIPFTLGSEADARKVSTVIMNAISGRPAIADKDALDTIVQSMLNDIKALK
jgi:hypothetical protein